MKNSLSPKPLNQIFYGPPGTGKTYTTITETLSILDPEFLLTHVSERSKLKQRFDELLDEGRIKLTTFHQSFSYEDFVEGLKVATETDGDTDSSSIKYSIVDGVFKSLCDSARVQVSVVSTTSIDLKGKKIWKMSLGEYRTESEVYDYCIENECILLGFGHATDFSDCYNYEAVYKKTHVNEDGTLSKAAPSMINTFKNKLQKGDIVVITEGNLKFRAIGQIIGDYEFIKDQPFDDQSYRQSRKVRWLRTYKPAKPFEDLSAKQFSQRTLYELSSGSVRLDKLNNLINSQTVNNPDTPRVLIIDEINRGNVSKIFGELITLIEPSKREGASEALNVVLPYSKESFSVPSNVYIIGTMNTADRSLMGLDIALRRRFDFIELAPNPELLQGIEVEGVNIRDLLTVMNQRIEVLLDRDHCIGHAYFLPLKEDNSLGKLAKIFKHQVFPLLQEYFFEDWERIAMVLNIDFKDPNQFLTKPTTSLQALFGSDVAEQLTDRRFLINFSAFERVENYKRILNLTYEN